MSRSTAVMSGVANSGFWDMGGFAANPDGHREFRRGQVWLVAFDPAVGHEIQKTRPAVVISADRYNKHVQNRIVVVVPLKGKAPDKPVRYDQVVIRPPEGGLKKVSVTVSNQLRGVSIDRLVGRLGEVSEESMQVIDQKTATVLGLAKGER